MNQQQGPATPFALSLIAGIFLTLGATMRIIASNRMTGMADRWGMQWDSEPWFIPAVIFGFIFAGVVIYSAIMLNTKPEQHVLWGILIIVFSVSSIFTSWGGFGIGMILGIIGGTLAITYRAAIATDQQLSIPSSGSYCPKCGQKTPAGSKYCLHCGRELPS